jgi:segregation and condensation protein A
LLLHLIRAQKLEIRDIPIAEVTDQYLAYLAMMEALDLDVAGEFLVMAATLMEIKSRMLLPRPEPDPDEEDETDPRAELVARLLEYDRFQQAARKLEELAQASARSFPRPAPESWDGALPLVELAPRDLAAALLRLAAPAGEESGARGPSLRLRRQSIHLHRRVAEVLRRLEAADGTLTFGALVGPERRHDRLEVLVTFLALLELLRTGRVRAWQRGVLGEITIRLRRKEEGSEPADVNEPARPAAARPA